MPYQFSDQKHFVVQLCFLALNLFVFLGLLTQTVSECSKKVLQYFSLGLQRSLFKITNRLQTLLVGQLKHLCQSQLRTVLIGTKFNYACGRFYGLAHENWNWMVS